MTIRGKKLNGVGGRRKPRAPRAARLSAVFLDRDGTITDEVGYINHLSRLRVYPWAAEAIHKLNLTGRPVIVVTNQSGVARGYFTEQLIHQAHEKISRAIAARRASVDAFYYCPHHPEGRVAGYKTECSCRKPATGMIMEAARKFRIDLASSYVVGDSYRDMQLGFNAGTRTILVMTGYGRGEYEYHRHGWPRLPDHVAGNLLEAAEIIVNERARGLARVQRKAPALQPV